MPTSIEHRRLDANNILVQRSPPSITRYLVPGISCSQFRTRYGTYTLYQSIRESIGVFAIYGVFAVYENSVGLENMPSIILKRTNSPTRGRNPTQNKNWVKSGILGPLFPAQPR